MKNKSLALLWAITDCILLSVLSIILKYLINTWWDIINTSFLTLFVATIIIFIFAKFTKQDLNIWINNFKYILFIAFLSSVIWYPIWLLSMKYTTMINITFLWNLSVVFTIIFSYFFIKKKNIIKEILFIFVLLFWCYLFIINWNWLNLNIWDLIVILWALNFSILMLFTEKLLWKINPILFVFYRALLWSIMLLIWLIIFWKLNLHINFLALFAWLITWFWIIVFSKTIYHWSANYLIQMKTLSPILTAILAIIFLWEEMILMQFIGAWVILFSLYFLHKYHD